MAQNLVDSSPDAPVVLRDVPRWLPEWAIPEVPVSESDTHDAAIEWLRALLVAWVERTSRNIKVARNLGIRWVREEPRNGFDPDLCLIEPAPDATRPLHSLRLWKGDHPAPRLAIEVVSPGHPYKDYIDTPARCAACGVVELWVYDPMLAGPRARGGPHLLQVWRRRDDGGFERVSAGAEPVRSPVVNAWLHPRASPLASGAQLLISDDREGRELWLSNEQRARESEQQARTAEQQAREQLERSLKQQAELEAELRRLKESTRRD